MATEPKVATKLEELEVETVEVPERPHGVARFWSWLWPKLAALALFLLAWQLVVWSGWRPGSVLPGPIPVFGRLAEDLGRPDFYAGVAITMQRALIGYALAIVIGSVIGVLVARIPIVRKAVGHVILSLQSMPSIVWLPIAILVFARSEAAILLVVILGAAPVVAIGLLGGIDQVQPQLVRIGRVLGARGLRLYRYVILPAALPGYLGGLKQGWAFSWRSLMSAELITTVSQQPSIGQQLQLARNAGDARELLALMIGIFFIGAVVDLGFGFADRAIRRRRGLA